ncbi:hypothetical protein [Cryobacterium sp. TMT4-10]|uniref:hypothetical protein n=1 Tax=Cryobacterium sp. TMT4-10 TaxID=1259256 RepID=UPI001069A8B2|nr:hypothetical protein [Cryobacterium sp. TMT4-10]TFD13171.1 hypothetical protein E3T42_14120 [Cryobacterium sp. TMT4-10]
MDRNRLWVLGAVVLIGVTLVLGWLVGISPNLTAASVANTDRVAVEEQNKAAGLQLVELKKQFESIGDLKKDLTAIREAVPSGPEIPAFLSQLDTLSRQNEVTLTDFSVGDAEPYAPEGAAPVAAATPSDASTPAPTAAPADGTAAPAADPATAAGATVVGAALPVAPPGITANNFVAVPITVSVEGNYSKLLDFTDGLQTGKRLALVTSIETTTVSPEISTAKISAYVYVLLNPATATPTPAG